MRLKVLVCAFLGVALASSCAEPRGATEVTPDAAPDVTPEVRPGTSGTGGSDAGGSGAAPGTGGSPAVIDALDAPMETAPDVAPGPPLPPVCTPAANYCCSDTDCPPMAGKQGKCDGTMHSCQYSCEGDTKPCGGVCIPSAGCCDPNSCAGNFACVANSCSASACKTGYKLCGATCIPSNGCCDDSQCTGNFACVGQVCSTTMCRAGQKLCNGKCIAAAACCGHGDCGRCEKCSNNACVAQSNEDVKNECGGNKCGAGRCNDCNPSSSNTCKDANTQRSCKATAGHYAYADTNCPRGCGTGGTCCGAGQESVGGGACQSCGGAGQPCCTRPSAGTCNDGRVCKAQNVCCGASEVYCPGTGGGKGCQSNVICDASRWPDVGIYADTNSLCGFAGNGSRQQGMQSYPYFWQVGSCDSRYMAWAAELCQQPASTVPGALPQIYIDAHTYDANGANPVWKRAYTCRCSPTGAVEECVKDAGFPGGP